MGSFEIRKKFLNFFEEKGHKILPPVSLISETDTSVLFTTAGMQQFKSFYLNPEIAPALKIATVQPCVRTSDIEEVGDESHLTFFEMLGNFSFGYPAEKGSYFKEKAIKLAWEFLIKILKIGKERISATYFQGGKNIKQIPADQESLKILKEIIKLPEDKIQGKDINENFWSLGIEGSPAGPTVEFYVSPPGALNNKDKAIEVWNLVFNEYILEKGKYKPSEFKGVDTGMGLERLTAVVQGEKDVFKTDLFLPIIKILEKILKANYEKDFSRLRILADHFKAASFLISAGLAPSNKDQGYVLRKLIRRLLLHSQISEIKKDWLKEVIEKITEIYSELASFKEEIVKIIFEEMIKFQKTLEKGKKIIERLDTLNAKIAFDLYQTYGFPFELSKEYAVLKNIEISDEDFQKEFDKHRELSRSASAGKFKGGLADSSIKTVRLHTAAHLLLAALRKILGSGVVQKGSNITSERLRFDFSYPEKLTPEQLRKIENLVNEQIKKALPVRMKEMSLAEAKKSGAMGVFEYRYGKRVKVYSINDFSREICGGPHAKNTSELGHFKIIKEESSSAGVRRIKAILE